MALRQPTCTGLANTYSQTGSTRLEAPRILSLHNKTSTMRFLRSLIPSLLLLGANISEAASSWNFDKAILSVTGKGGADFKDK